MASGALVTAEWFQLITLSYSYIRMQILRYAHYIIIKGISMFYCNEVYYEYYINIIFV